MEKIELLDNWVFYRDHSTVMSAFSPSQEEKTTVTLPHDAMLAGERKPENKTGPAGAYYPGENYIYERIIYAADEWTGAKMLLEFDGVYNKSMLYVNDQFVCGNDYGYSGFSADIGPFLKYGQENLIRVKVCNGSVPNSRWYSGAGIYRPVRLWIGKTIYIKKDSLRITTPEVSEDISQVNVEIVIVNRSGGLQKIQAHVEITDQSGRTVAEQNIPATLFPESQERLHTALYIRKADLWSVDDPNLYKTEVRITLQDELCDSEETIFGLRRIQIDPDNGLRINGVRTLLRGACIHHDNGILGAAEYKAAELRRIRKLKEAGFNAVRTAHNPASKEVLDACDRLGILVMEECFDQWTRAKNPYDYANDFQDSWKIHMERLVAKDFNHPSVVFYCIGNEIQELATHQGARLNREISNYVRKLDPSRFVTNAINGMMTVMECMDGIMTDLGLTGGKGDVNDVMTGLMEHNDEMTSHPVVAERLEEVFLSLDAAGYNYMRGRGEIDTKRDLNRMVVGTETFPADIDLNWNICKNNPAVLGDFTWTGWDYMGEAGIGIEKYKNSEFHARWPAYIAYCGDIDITGERRPFSYYREIVFGLRKEPYIAVQLPERYGKEYCRTPWGVPESISSWSFEGYEGAPCIVEVYSDAEEVELLVNGKSIGKKGCGRENRYRAVFDTVFEPGNIRTVSYRKGKAAEEYCLASAGAETVLRVCPDKRVLKAGEQDLSFIDICITDEHGIIKPYHPERIRVSLTGKGTLMGTASANPITDEHFGDPEHTTYLGRMQTIVRSGAEAGKIHLNVRTESGQESSIELETH